VKELKIEIDGRVLFHSDVLEVQWQENDEQVTVTGRFTKAPTLQDMLMAEAMKRQAKQDLENTADDSDVVEIELPDNVSRIPDNRE
jgi:hypothetical protein